MNLNIFKCNQFDHKYAEDRFGRLTRFLEQQGGPDEKAILIANYRLGGAFTDACLIDSWGVTLFLFKNLSGLVRIFDRGPWLADGKMVLASTMCLYPGQQARSDYRCVYNALQRYLGDVAGRMKIRICMLLNDDARVEDCLDEQTRMWLRVGPLSLLHALRKESEASEPVVSESLLKCIPDILGLVWAAPDEAKAAEELLLGVDGARMASLFYKSLERLTGGGPYSIHERYAALREVYRQVIDRGVERCHLHFAGRFAKLDYLLKEHNLTGRTASQIHATRLSLALSAAGAGEQEMERNFLYDVKNVIRLISGIWSETTVPVALWRSLPTDERKWAWGEFDTDVLKCVVESWDDSFLYVTEEQNGTRLKVCYGMQNRYLTREGQGDWSYLKTILWPEAQLNLVRLRFEGDICMPELIIFEPDYLVNVTTVASCFESFAESPFVNILNKLKPQPCTKHIFLGSLSGRYLDDTVHQKTCRFEDTLRQFFQSHAIGLAACDDLNSATDMAWFCGQAREQQQNIEKLIGQDLPSEVHGYDSRNVVLEPSFFSHVLGLQGRLDFLFEKDKQVAIIEQKSGKSAYTGRQDSGDVQPQEQHLVQLILYRAIFAYEFGRYADQLKHVMLLYSKYANGLISVGQNPQLMLRAIRMRNLLAWSEIQYAKDGIGILDTFTPDSLNQKQVSGTLWERFQRPQIEQLLQPLHQAAALERMYYHRFMRFLSKEQLLAKVGNKEKEGSGFASLWNDTLEEKKLAGNIYEELTIESLMGEGEAVERVRLRFPQAISADTSNFRRGDIVVLYPYRRGQTPSPCAQMVHRASIEAITVGHIELILRNAQTDKRIFIQEQDLCWAVEHDMIEASASSLYRGLYSFFSASQERRDLVLCRRKATVDKSYHRKGDYGSFNLLVERAKQARDLFLIIGPPGTGKTSYGLLNLLREELLEDGSNVLLLSYTNRAVDEICSKLSEQAIDFVRLGSYLSCEPAYRDNLLSERVKTCRNRREVKHLIQQTRVFCATTSALNGSSELLHMKQFDLAIVDESSQILEPHLIGLLSARQGNASAIRRFVLIGDHKQLPAVVQQDEEESEVEEPELRRIHLTNCRLSLFERFLTCFKTSEGYDPDYVYMLTRQGRMHRDIAEFPNRAFYGGRLDIVPLDHQVAENRKTELDNGIAQLLSCRRLLFVASARSGELLPMKANPMEAAMIAATVRQIYELTKHSFSNTQTVGVIVPYRNQIATVRGAIDKYGIDVLHDITIDTVERYQGSQRDYIIYGFTVQQPFQLKFLTNNVFVEDGQVIDRKLNVAMTRARTHLVLIGNPVILREDAVFKQLMDFVRQRDGYVDMDCQVYCQGRFSVSDALHS